LSPMLGTCFAGQHRREAELAGDAHKIPPGLEGSLFVGAMPVQRSSQGTGARCPQGIIWAALLLGLPCPTIVGTDRLVSPSWRGLRIAPAMAPVFGRQGAAVLRLRSQLPGLC